MDDLDLDNPFPIIAIACSLLIVIALFVWYGFWTGILGIILSAFSFHIGYMTNTLTHSNI